ncbi:MAG: hypothetical protein JNK82_23890 [Myxococcaceae bacterium]|nr:hypothetical protein [Myxococcaceae bacterium]
MIQRFVAEGHVCDVALGVFALELLWLQRKKVRLGDLAGQLVAGAFLILAVRAALTGASVWVVVALLAASFPAHLFDLVRRVRAR